MISRQCCIWFLWLIVVKNVNCYTSQAKTLKGDRFGREATTDILESPEKSLYSIPDIPKNHPCYPFSVADFEKQQFFSPGYPAETYTNNSDCVLVLEAPPGYLVKLDFRDWFAVEPSTDCKNDFLEVRDGPHGYNNLIYHPFCGFKFPQELTSTDRHLWIHFKSDENIEYKGFRAVFEFIPRSESTSIETPEIIPCIIDLDSLEEGFLGKNNISHEIIKFNQDNNLPIDCLWSITVKEGRKIQLQFQKFSLEKPNECDSNFIQVFSSETDMSHLDRMFCGSMADTVNSQTHKMFLRFFNEAKGIKSTFEANFTEFRALEKNGDTKQGCYEDEFDCEDATCISRSLKCNGRYNCRHRWDEDDCYGSTLNTQSLSLSEDHIVIIMVIFSLILSGMCFTFIFNCVKKLIRDHHTIQEYIRQSREQQLNELDKQVVAAGKANLTDKKETKIGGSSKSNSSPSSDSRHFDVVNAVNVPCYVPGGELLPILIRNEHSLTPSNGDIYTQNIYTVDSEHIPEMCDSACQTRESLFTNQAYSSGNSTPNNSLHTSSPPAPFSTFGYRKDSNKFKAEAKIEMTPAKFEDKRRPYSVQTTKSAPDVIVTH